MAFLQLVAVISVVLAFSRIELTVCSLVKGSVMCTDCDDHYDYSGMRVLIKCDQVKKLTVATTDGKGGFEVNLPANVPTLRAAPSPNCLAKLLGGPIQVYARRQNIKSEIVKAQGVDNTYTVATPLAFARSCGGKCGSGSASYDASKTFDLPIPPEYGLPPTSYYTPLLPIIGIP